MAWHTMNNLPSAQIDKFWQFFKLNMYILSLTCYKKLDIVEDFGPWQDLIYWLF